MDESIFEQNGVWYFKGNKTLCNLNLSKNSITDDGVQWLLDAVVGQETTSSTPSVGTDPVIPPAMFQISLSVIIPPFFIRRIPLVPFHS